MMDIDDGYILWTGIWKALGNSKADIVKMIDSQPDLAPLIRRVRGGYLKIQGTWMPYEVALKLSRRVAWNIRHDLVPLFGPTFPSTCLSPDQPGYGQVVATSQTRRRARRNTQAAAITQIPREPHSTWTVVTPGGPGAMSLSAPHHPTSQFNRRPSLIGISPDPSEYSSSPQYPHRHIDSPDYHNASRYAPYSSHSSPIDRKSSVGAVSGRGGLSLEIPPHVLNRPSSSKPPENISLPPIKQSEDSDRDSGSPYALPPISALEDLRGVDTQDSAAVLRRLRLDDDYPTSSSVSSSGDRSDPHWIRRHSVSAHPHSNRSSESSRFQPYHSPRSYQDYTFKRSRSPPESLIEQRRRSDFSQEDCYSNPSPISPATPNSGLSSFEGGPSSFSDLKKLASMTDRRYPFPRISAPASRDWGMNGNADLDNIRSHRSPLDVDSDSESSSIPHRPWL
ncbi:hypothetical protein FA13DRAFT_1732420 [Coprinellus micaceus]|uniref:HTH APSES-type domain-containing protein n=1 Tax=Coprinellus micaceus TaxID=71717 RepID=A0A4Y7TBN7_COPMI|nr:hypothetical protein FA13DRAFT_1732420 [Coprinellus micaceus]